MSIKHAAYIIDEKRLDTPLTLTSLRGVVYKKALLDSEAIENFINNTTVEHLKLGTILMKTPVTLRNINETSNKSWKIIRYLDLQVAKGNKKATQWFFISHLRGDRIILGYSWLSTFNPNINWAAQMILGPAIKLSTLAYRIKMDYNLTYNPGSAIYTTVIEV